jgi:hypothetical protein
VLGMRVRSERFDSGLGSFQCEETVRVDVENACSSIVVIVQDSWDVIGIRNVRAIRGAVLIQMVYYNAIS